jgi:hypothetical protein
MGLLDGGGAALMASVFSSFYLDATLHRPTLTDDGQGGGSTTWTDEPVKVQLEAATEAMRQAEGYIDVDIRILMLAHGVDRPDSDCEVSVTGHDRYSIQPPIGRDPAGAYWDLRGRPV